MDKKNGQIQKIDKRILNHKIKEDIRKILQQVLAQSFTPKIQKTGLHTQIKEDHSIVTEIDLEVSRRLRELFTAKAKEYCFFSEEDHGNLSFPAIVLDPIDGTKELVRGIPECTLSLAILESAEMEGEGWIYNPFTGFEVSNDVEYTLPVARRERIPLGLVSQSEWDDGLFAEDRKNAQFILAPRGSMANKLFLLATGACEFVVTKRPKSLWDIAAGCLILDRQGIQFYCAGKRVTSLSQVVYEDGPLIWTLPEHAEAVLKHFIIEK